MKQSYFSLHINLKAGLWLIITILLTGVPVGRAAEQARERIIYASFRPANMDLYLFDSPGATPRPLATHPALDYNPVFSPDGQWVVFCSERRGNPDLYALDLQNPGPPRLLTLKILITTLLKKERYVDIALAAGADGYCLKEDAADELLSAVEMIRQGRTYVSSIIGGQDPPT